MANERFPIQDGPSVPWAFMAPHEAQARKNHGQTLEGLAKRGGLGCAEAWVIIHGLKHMDILHEEHKRKWIELTERVNREWSIEHLLADEREPMECGHPKACLVQREISNIEKNEGPLNDTEYCSACVEWERVREMCAEEAQSRCLRVMDGDSPCKRCRQCASVVAIRQLDLTVPSSTEEGKPRRFTMEVDFDEKGG